MTLNRAYSVLTLKAADDDKRIIEGIATTPSPDRSADVVEPRGMEFKLPLPLLRSHKSDQPIGNVISAKVTKDGIAIKAQIAPSGVAAYIDETWSLIKAGLIRGLSIGFRSLEETFDRERGGFNFLRTEWLELSTVVIPMQQDATILTVKSIDASLLAASGDRQSGVARLDTNLPGVSGLTTKTKGKTMTISEQITQFENKRAASVARMTAIMEKSAETGSTLEAAEEEEHDTLQTEVESIDKHLVRLRLHEKTIVSKAVAVTPDVGADPKKAADARGGHVVQVKSNLPKGTMFSRWVMAQVEAKGDKYRAPEIAKQFWPDMPEVEMILRAGVNAGTTTGTTWAAPLVPAAQTMTEEFYGLLRPMSIIGRIPGLRRVPANIIVPVQTGGGTGNWVGETLPKPVSALAFTTATLRWAKAVVMTVLSEELIRFSSPNAEAVVRESIAKDLAAFEDAWFVSATIESANVSPAGIRWNAPTSAATGVTAATFLTDFKTALATFIAANYDLAKLVILMSSTSALNVSTLKDSLGNFIYPTLNMREGGSLLGIPVIVSEAVGNNIIFLNADEIMLADDGGITIDASNQASILMDDAPNASPTTTSLVSLYQRNLVAIKAEHFLTWKKVKSTTAYVLTGVAYTG